ncbi:MAG: hypothetical protein QN178_06295 [Armatimonadota bacterium]|nr:hypothetical protein [Armatimonadota bacterium]
MLYLRALRHRPETLRTVITVMFLITVTVLLSTFIGGQAVEDARAAMVVVAVILISTVAFYTATRHEQDGDRLYRLLMLALILKLGAVAFRLWLIFSVYGGVADAVDYHLWGIRLAEGGVTRDLISGGGSFGTNNVRMASGLFYFVTGPTFIGAFVFWAWLGLLGMWMFYRAFVTAIPHGDRRVFSLLILLYPSMILWTSSLGKDALSVFFLGMATYGVALLSRHVGARGMTLAAAGVAGLLMVRPHIAAAFVAAGVGASLFRPFRLGLLGPVVKVLAIAAFAVGAIVLVRFSASALQLDDLSAEGVLEFIEERAESTERGGAAIERGLPTDPVAFADGVLTVFFRPYPWEARNIPAMISAVEGSLLFLLMFFIRRRSVVAAIREARSSPLVIGAIVYALLFAFMFSAVSNYAIIARQRVQLLPFVFVLIAYLGTARPARRGLDARVG